MSVYSSEYHAMVMSPGPAQAGSAPAVAKGVDAAEAPHESFFHHLLDVVNPLQHLPVIGTIYRALTGEHLDPVEKIAGDTLYGGLWGAVTSIADVAFEGITGKSFEDTALALFKKDDGVRVASHQVAAPSIAANPSLPSSDLPSLPASGIAGANISDGLDVASFTSALSAKGIDGDTASRALYAYRRSMGLTAPLPVLASVN